MGSVVSRCAVVFFVVFGVVCWWLSAVALVGGARGAWRVLESKPGGSTATSSIFQALPGDTEAMAVAVAA